METHLCIGRQGLEMSPSSASCCSMEHKEMRSMSLEIQVSLILSSPHLLALMFACVKGSLPAVRRLHKAGVKLDLVNSSGMTALMLASVNGHSDCISFLLHEGADLRLKNKKGLTALALTKDEVCDQVSARLMMLGMQIYSRCVDERVR